MPFIGSLGFPFPKMNHTSLQLTWAKSAMNPRNQSFGTWWCFILCSIIEYHMQHWEHCVFILHVTYNDSEDWLAFGIIYVAGHGRPSLDPLHMVQYEPRILQGASWLHTTNNVQPITRSNIAHLEVWGTQLVNPIPFYFFNPGCSPLC